MINATTPELQLLQFQRELPVNSLLSQPIKCAPAWWAPTVLHDVSVLAMVLRSLDGTPIATTLSTGYASIASISRGTSTDLADLYKRSLEAGQQDAIVVCSALAHNGQILQVRGFTPGRSALFHQSVVHSLAAIEQCRKRNKLRLLPLLESALA